MLIFIIFSLFIYDQSVSIFQSIFSSTIKTFCNFRPFFHSFIIFDKFQKFNIFMKLPRPFTKLWAEITSPMLSALFCISKTFIRLCIHFIQGMRYLFPIFYLTCMLWLLIYPLINYHTKKIRLLCSPIIHSKCNFFKTQPFEHTNSRSDTWNKCGNKFPILFNLNDKLYTIYFSASLQCLSSQYLEIIQISMIRSSSPQFLLILLVFIILN